MSLPILAAPQVFKPLALQAELLRLLAGLQLRMRDPLGGDEPSYSMPLPSDPAYQVLSTSAYRYQLQMQAINEAVESNLLLYARGSDLDHLAAFYDVLRLEGEADDAFRGRVQLSIRGWSPGTYEYYESQVRGLSTEVRDVLVDVPDTQAIDQKGWIYISVMVNEGSGEPSTEFLTQVRSHLADPKVRLINDTIVVQPVSLVPIDVVASIWQTPSAIPGVLERLNASVPLAFDQARGLGWDVSPSWFASALQQDGVKKSELSLTQDVVVARDQCAYLRSFSLLDKGVAW
ncbi:Phage-related baseplate assembly protein [Thiothrix eikelboomii]|uniref:Phage-related baseplate assembly protein n=1 Tax=Thiothrix eikelboomii TaxID=92487 RepID=A0A1T4W4N2_9GAMM|nr:baseplate J/gp47 family protein [Thiothrix eikelboomii]SKA72230.1 Phage-related baseplate assembly protein [Thiothrix eikelboomii]